MADALQQLCILMVCVWMLSCSFCQVAGETSAGSSVVNALKSHRNTKENKALFKSRNSLNEALFKSRKKRAVYISESDKQRIVNKHNEQRRQQNAADMNVLVWNDYLADLALQWAGGCVWEHGQPDITPGFLSYSGVGQNLFAGKGYREDQLYDLAIGGWYGETKDYNYDKNSCTIGKQCGHYTQIVWGATREVGCAWYRCPQIDKLRGYNDAHLVVCNYGPAGNRVNQKPYTLGAPCSKCGTGKAWCTDNLCNEKCSQESHECACKATCRNCGTRMHDCTCQCADGWTGVDCSEECKDKHENCNKVPGWPKSWCTHAQHASLVSHNCPQMCEVCKSSADPCRDGVSGWVFGVIFSLVIVIVSAICMGVVYWRRSRSFKLQNTQPVRTISR